MSRHELTSTENKTASDLDRYMIFQNRLSEITCQGLNPLWHEVYVCHGGDLIS